MKALPLSLLLAIVFGLASATQAMVILHVKEDLSDPNPDFDLQVDLELIAVSGGGLNIIGFEVVAPSPITLIDGWDFSTFDFLGFQGSESEVLWGSLGGPLTNGYFPAILTFSIAEAGSVDLGGVVAFDDFGNNISGTVLVNPYVIPEPVTLSLLVLGLSGLALSGRGRGRHASHG